jgi:D-alanine--poly(phosphoribitol) ligase subunit 2
VSAPSRQEVEKGILSFVEEHFLVEHGTDFEMATNLFEARIIDSFGFVELVRFLESEFKIRIKDTDLVSGELTSVQSMANLVEQRAYDSTYA